MSPLDPVVAALRCWEHEDCLEHPELGLACADGRVTRLGGELDDDWGCRFWPARDQSTSCQRFFMPGNGQGMPRAVGYVFWYGSGVGEGHDDDYDQPGGNGHGDPSWYDTTLRDDHRR